MQPITTLYSSADINFVSIALAGLAFPPPPCFPAPSGSVASPACNHKMSGLLVLCAILGIGTRQPGTSVWSAVFSFSLLPYLVVSQYLH